MANKRLSILVIAEAANPDWVSVPLVGWSLANALRVVADVHIVTQVRNREAIIRAGLKEGHDFTVIDTEMLARPLWRLSNFLRMGDGKGWTMVTAISSLSYFYFERKVWKRFSKAIEAGKFDVVHRITPLTPTASSPIAAKCASIGVPFVVGPLNGGVPWPKGFHTARREEREWLSYLRGFYKLFPSRRATWKASNAILAGSRHTQSEIPQRFQDKTIYLPENGIDEGRFNLKARQDLSGPLKACFVGRLVPYKGVDMLLEAAAPLLKDGKLILDIIGDGPMRHVIEAQIKMEGLEKGVKLHGWLEHGDVQKVLAGANLLTFPSIREFGGGVVIEAMSLGVVPVVVDYAGPGELVDRSNGYKVAIGSRDEIVHRLGLQLAQIVNHPSILIEKSAAARTRVREHFTWTAKAKKIHAVYEWVLGDISDKPILETIRSQCVASD